MFRHVPSGVLHCKYSNAHRPCFCIPNSSKTTLHMYILINHQAVQQHYVLCCICIFQYTYCTCYQNNLLWDQSQPRQAKIMRISHLILLHVSASPSIHLYVRLHTMRHRSKITSISQLIAVRN